MIRALLLFLLLSLALLWPALVLAEAPIAVLEDGDRIELYESRPNYCTADARGARYIYRDGTPLEGCWKPIQVDGVWYVLTHFLDGDKLAFKPAQFSWADGKRKKSGKPGLM